METITLLFSPSELSKVRNISLSEIFEGIRQQTIPYQLTEDGIKIPVTYYID